MATKVRGRTVFLCQQCGSRNPRWVGRCPDCGQWNSLVETIESPRELSRERSLPRSEAQSLRSVATDGFQRIPVPLAEFSRVLGGGIVPGSLVLVGGDPGIGKSTLLLQLCAQIAAPGSPVLYASGEESAQQLKMRAARLGIDSDNLYVLAETALDQILESIERLSPRLVVVDSIQTMYLEGMSSAAGSVSQVRECALGLLQLAKGTNVPIFLVGHVTKEGTIAGPRALEHIVDTVLYLEGERFNQYRLLRGVKNRFGSTNEVGVFEMRGEGMVEVANPSQMFLAERTAAPGSTVIITLEGTRPLLVEVQALTTITSFGLPRRTANGIDFNRLLLLTAVLTKRVGLALSNQDIYVNIVGGLRVEEPAADLGTALAIASSFRDVPAPPDLAVFGEVGLAGELRSVGHVEKRLTEAAKLGFQRCLLPRSNYSHRLANGPGLQVISAQTVREALGVLEDGKPREQISTNGGEDCKP